MGAIVGTRPAHEPSVATRSAMKGWSRCSAWSDTRPADDRPKRRTLDPDAALAGTDRVGRGRWRGLIHTRGSHRPEPPDPDRRGTPTVRGRADSKGQPCRSSPDSTLRSSPSRRPPRTCTWSASPCSIRRRPRTDPSPSTRCARPRGRPGRDDPHAAPSRRRGAVRPLRADVDRGPRLRRLVPRAAGRAPRAGRAGGARRVRRRRRRPPDRPQQAAVGVLRRRGSRARLPARSSASCTTR